MAFTDQSSEHKLFFFSILNYDGIKGFTEGFLITHKYKVSSVSQNLTGCFPNHLLEGTISCFAPTAGWIAPWSHIDHYITGEGFSKACSGHSRPQKFRAEYRRATTYAENWATGEALASGASLPHSDVSMIVMYQFNDIMPKSNIHESCQEVEGFESECQITQPCESRS